MDTKLILIVLVIYSVIQFNEACDQSAIICEKYCEIEKKSCGGLKHPLCSKFNETDEEPLFNAEKRIINLKTGFVQNTVLFEINLFRNQLAFGFVSNLEAAANLHAVKWSSDFQQILEAKLKYKNVCDHISLNHNESVDYWKFVAHLSEHRDSFVLTELTSIINASYVKMKWPPLLRAEFTKIGCVVTNENSGYTLHCFTNKVGTFDSNVTYIPGDHCKLCECSIYWRGLCDDDAPTTIRVFGFNETVFYIMIGLIVFLFLVISISGFIFWLCFECISKPAESGTYTLRHKFSNKPCEETLFEQDK